MRKIGFANGCLYKIMDVFSPECISVFDKCGCEAIEFSVINRERIEKAKDIVPFIGNFSYRTIHIPGRMRFKKDIETKEMLDKIYDFYKLAKADLMLVHPDLVDDWTVFDEGKGNLAIENMDWRKPAYKTPEDFKKFFRQHANWQMVLDLNHCYTNDKSMSLAEEFINEFSNKIVEIHLSGFESLHEPIYKTKQDFILEFCKKIDCPIIMESVFENTREVEKEYNYVKNFLSQ